MKQKTAYSIITIIFLALIGLLLIATRTKKQETLWNGECSLVGKKTVHNSVVPEYICNGNKFVVFNRKFLYEIIDFQPKIACEITVSSFGSNHKCKILETKNVAN